MCDVPVMANYIRPRVPGATVFFTVCLAHRGTSILTDHVDILREAVVHVRGQRPFGIDAWVILPDHMHAVWTLPEGDANYSQRWGSIKARFSRFLRLRETCARVGSKPTLRQEGRVGFQPTDVDRLRGARSASKVAKKDAGIWQRRFWDHHIRGREDYASAVHFCHMDPVNHGLVERPEEWLCSSIHREIRDGRWAA